MTDKPPNEVQDEPGAEERFERGVANALKMPPRPHSNGGGPKAAPAVDQAKAGKSGGK